MRKPRDSPRSKFLIPRLPLAVYLLILSLIPGIFGSAIITLGSIDVFTTHGWLISEPTYYFYCQGENKTILPDVKETEYLYTFKGEESWQPLTELPSKKCKRCGLYQEQRVKADDVLDEWELCLVDFINGTYVHYKDEEFNATFTCSDCAGAVSSVSKNWVAENLNVILSVIVGVLASFIIIAGVLSIHRYWQNKRREQEQARFLKMFNDGDDIEDVLEQF